MKVSSFVLACCTAMVMLPWPAPAFGASFDCKAGRLTSLESAICDDPTLSELDVVMARVFGRLTKSADARSSVVDGQRAWLAYRDAEWNSCTDRPRCIEQLASSYRARIGALVLRQASVSAPGVDALTLTASPTALVADHSLEEWTQRFWHWLLYAPNDLDPALDRTGAYCHYAQSGAVWFLAGTTDARPVIRYCRVPADKYLYVPVRADLVRPTPSQTSATCQESLQILRSMGGNSGAPYFRIDGDELESIRDFAVQAQGCFDPTMTGRAVSAVGGYGLLVKPLTPGTHVIEFGVRGEMPPRKDTTVVLEVTRDPVSSPPYPQTGPRLAEGPDSPASLNYYTNETPGFRLSTILQRLVTIIDGDGRYEIVSSDLVPMGAEQYIAIVPKDLVALLARYPDLNEHVRNQPLFITGEHYYADGRLRFTVTHLSGNASPSADLRKAWETDAQRFLVQALDKNVAVSDLEIARSMTKPRRTRQQAFVEPAASQATTLP